MTRNLIFLCFLLVQLFDWVATLQGVSRFGTSIEGNPLIRFLMEKYGVLLVITAAKLIAVSAASVLYYAKRHRLIAMLTVLYMIAVVIPWLLVLA